MTHNVIRNNGFGDAAISSVFILIASNWMPVVCRNCELNEYTIETSAAQGCCEKFYFDIPLAIQSVDTSGDGNLSKYIFN